MRGFLIVVMSLFAFNVYGQKMTPVSLYEKYAGKKGYTTIELSADIIKLMGSGASADGSALDGVESIRIVMEEALSEGFVSDMRAVVSGKNYKLIMSLNDGEDKISLYKATENKREHFVMLLSSEDKQQNVFIYMVGSDISINNITSIGKILPGNKNK